MTALLETLAGFKQRVPLVKPRALIPLPCVPPPSKGGPGRLLSRGGVRDGRTVAGAGNKPASASGLRSEERFLTPGTVGLDLRVPCATTPAKAP